VAKKLYYKIGEACKLVEIQPYVLRFWETEFPFLTPDKSKAGQRVYGEREIEVIRRIKDLLYDEGYTIAGAKKKLEAELSENSSPKTGAQKAGSSKAKTTPGQAKSRQDSKIAVDTGAAQKIELLRAGIEGALKQARDILGTLAVR
jgi:DNA-binding transcriptional MerR regulator